MPDPLDTESLISEITQSIHQKIDSAVGGIPAPVPVDLSALEAGLNQLRQLIQSRPVFQPTDLGPITDAVNHATSITSMMKDNGAHVLALISDALSKLQAYTESTAHEKLLHGISTGSLSLAQTQTPEQEAKGNKIKSLAQKYGLTK